MFERFTHEARAVVVGAQEESAALGHNYIGTEHLLCGLLRQGHGPAAEVLVEHGLDLETARAALVEMIGRGAAPTSTPDDDAAALRALGIDLDAVRARVEEAFGPGALDQPPVPSRRRSRRTLRARRRFSRRGCLAVGPGGSRPFAPRAKKALELSLREALRLGHGYLGPEHILLGLIAIPDSMAAHVLQARGIALGEVRRRLLDRLGRVA